MTRQSVCTKRANPMPAWDAPAQEIAPLHYSSPLPSGPVRSQCHCKWLSLRVAQRQKQSIASTDSLILIHQAGSYSEAHRLGKTASGATNTNLRLLQFDCSKYNNTLPLMLRLGYAVMKLTHLSLMCHIPRIVCAPPISTRVGRPIRVKVHAKDDSQSVIFRFSRRVLTIFGTAPSRAAGLLRAIIAYKQNWLAYRCRGRHLARNKPGA